MAIDLTEKEKTFKIEDDVSVTIKKLNWADWLEVEASDEMKAIRQKIKDADNKVSDENRIELRKASISIAMTRAIIAFDGYTFNGKTLSVECPADVALVIDSLPLTTIFQMEQFSIGRVLQQQEKLGNSQGSSVETLKEEPIPQA